MLLFLSIDVDSIQVDCSFLFSLSPTQENNSRDLQRHSPAYWDQENWLAIDTSREYMYGCSDSTTKKCKQLFRNSIFSLMLANNTDSNLKQQECTGKHVAVPILHLQLDLRP